MKKKILSGVFAFAIMVTAGYGVNKVSNGDRDLSYLALSNVEALANGESGDGNTCYNSITTKDASQVFYCGTCDWEPGTNSWFSGKSTCTK